MDSVSGGEVVKAAAVDSRTGNRGSGSARKIAVADGALFGHFATAVFDIDNPCCVYSCVMCLKLIISDRDGGI